MLRQAEAGTDLVVLTGGTGLGARDVTPEAVQPLLHRPTPGISHGIMSASLAKTPLGALSRGVSGIYDTYSPDHKKGGLPTHSTLIITLPGSPKAVRECMDWLLHSNPSVLPHALKLIARDRAVDAEHRAMQGDLARSTAQGSATAPSVQAPLEHTGCGCDHPGVGARAGEFVTAYPGLPQKRQRVSPWPAVSLDAALAEIEANVEPLAGRETVEVGPGLVGRVLAEDIIAPHDLPPAPTSNMDGYAILSSTTPAGTYTLADSSSPAIPEQPRVCAINTGQPLPPDTDSVVPVEDTVLANAPVDRAEKVQLHVSGKAGANVRAAGSDVKASSVVLRSGTIVSALGGEVGTAAFVGRTHVQVRPTPSISVFSTGDEIVDVHAQDANASSFRVMDTNRPSLLAAVKGSGLSVKVADWGIISDNAEDVTRLFKACALGENAPDVVLSTGGTSMGQADVLKPVLERELGAVIHFGRVQVKPGKPTAYATLKQPSGKTTHFFTLPGNPASALVCYYLMVLPALRKLSGIPPAPQASARLYGFSDDTVPPSLYSLPRIGVITLSPLPTDPRPEFHRAVVKVTTQGTLVAQSTGGQRSSGMHSMATANALLCVPPSKTPTHIEAMFRVEAILLGPVTSH